MIGGVSAPIIITFAIVTGGSGNVVVNSGKYDAGSVALPVWNTGWSGASMDGGIGAGATISGGSISSLVTGGGGKSGVKVGKKVEAAGDVALPLSNTGCAVPAIDGGTGAGAIGNAISNPYSRLARRAVCRAAMLAVACASE
jgi:hypothetical protein